ncbi:MAG: hypothetical protein IJM63_08060 [Solobacterium sp.]|nr:hypothetical protein [Solobacterium sp.]
MDQKENDNLSSYVKELCPETFIFPIVLLCFFSVFVLQMGLANAINTMMNTAYRLLIDTVLYITAVCVLMGAVSSLLSEFGFVSLANYVLQPLMAPVFGLPGAAALGVVTTFLSDNPAILTLTEDRRFRHCFKKYQFPALTNLGTSFGMGLIVCTYMYALSPVMSVSLGKAVAMGLLGAVIGSIVSTRVMLVFTRKYYGNEADIQYDKEEGGTIPEGMRPIRSGGIGSRIMASVLDGGKSGVKMGISIVPGVLIICTIVMMLINGPSEAGTYTGAAYEGIRLLPTLASKIDFILKPMFGFSSPEAIGVPVTSLGAAGAALSLTATLASKGLLSPGDIAVFTAMCMCWSGYLSTHASMMDSLNSKPLIGKAILSHTLGGLCAGIAAHWLFVLL